MKRNRAESRVPHKNPEKIQSEVKKKLKTADPGLENYLHTIGKDYKRLTPDEEINLTKRIHQGDQQALDQLLKSNLLFVVSVAKKYQGQGLPLSDLISEGNLGLIKAAQRFDETRGFKFITYAVWWIRQSILQALSENAQVVRIPYNRQEQLQNLRHLEETYPADSIPDEEIARLTKLSLKDIKQAQKNRLKPISFDSPLKTLKNEPTEHTFHEIYPDPNALLPDQALLSESLKKQITTQLNSLTPREAEVIRLYFGLGYERPSTLTEIGERFKLTRERVRQIKEKAIKRLRHKSRSGPLRKDSA